MGSGLGNEAKRESEAAGYQYTCVGYCDSSGGPPRQPRGGAVLMGGSTDVDGAFEWLARQADGGDILVLRATGTGAYNQYIFDQGLCRSVATLVLTAPAAANDDFVIERIEAAHAIFFAGGDQWNYIRQWSGTRLQAAVQAAINRSVPVGGTSAGEAILTEHVFTAEHGGVTSVEALADPFTPLVALSSAPAPFLRVPFLQGVVADQHFRERDRMGRSLAFMARISQQRAAAGLGDEARAVCVDERTAVLLDTETGVASIVGTGTGSGGFHAAFMMRNREPPVVCEPATPLSYLGTEVQRMVAPSSGGGDGVEGTGGDLPSLFDFGAWQVVGGGGGETYSVDVVRGTVSDGAYGPPNSPAG